MHYKKYNNNCKFADWGIDLNFVKVQIPQKISLKIVK